MPRRKFAQINDHFLLYGHLYVFNISCRLLVGAPEADAGQAGVVRGGAVYKCRPDSPGQCDLIQFDQDGE